MRLRLDSLPLVVETLLRYGDCSPEPLREERDPKLLQHPAVAVQLGIDDAAVAVIQRPLYKPPPERFEHCKILSVTIEATAP